jgi:hypothetical protein
VTSTLQNCQDPSQAWWHIPLILALRRLRQEDCKFKARWATYPNHVTKQNKQTQIKTTCQGPETQGKTEKLTDWRRQGGIPP